MECALINNDKNLFDMEYRYIKVNLVTENFFIKWKEEMTFSAMLP